MKVNPLIKSKTELIHNEEDIRKFDLFGDDSNYLLNNLT